MKHFVNCNEKKISRLNPSFACRKHNSPIKRFNYLWILLKIISKVGLKMIHKQMGFDDRVDGWHSFSGKISICNFDTWWNLHGKRRSEHLRWKEQSNSDDVSFDTQSSKRQNILSIQWECKLEYSIFTFKYFCGRDGSMWWGICSTSVYQRTT